MKKQNLCAVLIFFFFYCINAQLDHRAELFIRSGYDDFAVLPSGKVYVATKGGMTYYAEKPHEDWRIGPIRVKEGEFDGEHMDRVSFFDNKIGIISGYLQDKKSDYIYRTTDGGESWKKIRLEKGTWIDAEDIDSNGNAWLASSDQVIYYSSDYGASWEIIDRPENETNQRIVTIDFISETEGIAGTGWNRLYYTKDNGKSWDILPTPLDQKKYTATEGHRPRIEKVILTEEEIFVNQVGKIFYTKKDEINWNAAADIFDFSYEQKILYIFNKNLEVCLYKSHYSDDSTEKFILPSYIPEFQIKDRKIYFLYPNYLQVVEASGNVNLPLLTYDYKIEESDYFQNTNSKWWAFDNGSCYHYEKKNRKYYRVNSTPLKMSNVYPIDNSKAILSTNHYTSHVFIDTENNSQKSILIDEFLNIPDIQEIESISFGKKNGGCFHFNENTVKYIMEKGKLVVDEVVKSTKGGELKGVRKNQIYDLERLNELIEILVNPRSFNAQEEFFNEEISRLMTDLKNTQVAKQNSGFIEGFFNYLTSPSLNEDYTEPIYSFSTNYVQKEIIIEYRNGKTIELYAQNSSESNVDLNWVVNIEGLKYNITDIAFWSHYHKGLNPKFYSLREKELVKELFKGYVFSMKK